MKVHDSNVNAIKKFVLVIVWLVMVKTPGSFALQPQGMVVATRPNPASSETSTVLHYRDNVQDEGGIKKGLYSQLPAHHKTTGGKMEVIRNMASLQFFSLLCVAGVAAGAMTLSGHAPDLNSIHWNDSEHFRPLFDMTDVSTWRFVQGILAATPMIYLTKHLETLDEPDMRRVNFSTINMVMTLFGRRVFSQQKNPSEVAVHPPLKTETPMVHALLFSTALAIATGICEEMTFRGMIPAAIFYLTHSVPCALFGQGILFGVGHLSPKATGGENKVVGLLQTASGIWYGSFYLMAGGDILPCIVAHVLYDSHVLMKTWMKANDQMDYTEEAVLQRLSKADEEQIRKIKQEVGSSLSAETLAFLRRFFYTFDYDHKGSLSKSDVQRAVAYAFLSGNQQPTEDRVNDLFERLIANREAGAPNDSSRRLMLPEFLRMVLFIRAHPPNAAA